MRIRNSYLPPPPLSSLSPKRLHYSDDQITFDRSPASQHVMISRINGRISRINSTSRTFNKQEQDQGIGHEEEMKFAPANQSLIGGWREEEKAMPFKKRRVINSEEEESDSVDRGKMVKGEENLMRCGRTDGRRWRCSRSRVEGYPMCEHHLLTRSARYRSENLKREIAEEVDQEEEETKKKKVVMEEKCENEDGKNNNNKRKVVKARSINSLLRESVPLLPLNL